MPSGQLGDAGSPRRGPGGGRGAASPIPAAATTAAPAPLHGQDLPVDPDVAIGELYRAHWHRLVRLAWLLLRDQLAAEDVVQDAFVATHRRWASIRDGGRVVGYLHTAVVNGCRSVQRHNVVVDRVNTATAGAADAPGRETVSSAEAAALNATEHEAMMRALAGLPDRQREVLVLRYYADLSEAQIAAALDISPGAVKSHAHRGLMTLRATMPMTEQP
jgi:RNA polymerase sigma-70 factor (sigma-E family)